MNLKRLFAPIAVLPLLMNLTRLDAQTLLWTLTKNGAGEHSYIFVNTTNTCETQVVISPKLQAALSKVKTLVFETGATNRANERIYLAAAQSSADDSYAAKQMLTPFVYTILKERGAEIGLTEKFLSQFNIFFVKNKLEASCIPCSVTKVVRLEDVLRDTAKKMGMPVTELLTINEFFDLYHHYPQTFWDKSITYLLDHPDRVSDALAKKAGAYKAEDLGGLKTAINSDGYYGIRYAFQDVETNRSTLLTTRIEKQLASSPTLVILDASEIANDPTSVFTRLTADGYTLTPVQE
jgi:uncharacterized protein YbaP (TraB family)